MMMWMTNDESLDQLSERLDTRLINQHLDIREKEIRAVADSMRASIAYAQEILGQ